MKRAIIIHGQPGKREFEDPNIPLPSQCHWIPWLKSEMVNKGFDVETPDMPIPYDPKYEDWKNVFDRYETDENTVLVGHSTGAGFLVRLLSENNLKIDKLFLVAPYINTDRDFFKFDIDLGDKVNEIHVFISKDDDKEMIESVGLLKEKVDGLIVHEFEDKGHFTIGDLGSDELPELLDLIV